MKDVTYADISFDPDRDTPSVLKEYADVRGINTNQFHFLTGDKKTIKSLLKDCNIYAIPGDTTIVGNDTSYFFIHTDRISVMGQDGKIRAIGLSAHTDMAGVLLTAINTGNYDAAMIAYCTHSSQCEHSQ